MNKKVVTKDALREIFETLRKEGKTTVALSGSFDVLHPGHIRLLQEARKKGDVLAVFLNSDASVRGYKGPGRPILSQMERAEMLASLEAVQYIVLFDELVPNATIRAVMPMIYCNGADWGSDCIEKEELDAVGGKLEILSFSQGFSTTALLKRIAQASSHPAPGAIFVDRDGTINERLEGYVGTVDRFILRKNTLAGLQKLSQAGWNIFVVTNQSGIGRGLFTQSQVDELHAHMLALFSKEGIVISKVYVCPHTPQAGCGCRKPGTESFLRAAEEYGLSLNKSWMIGDEDKDIRAGRALNMKTIRVRDSQHASREPALHEVDDLLEASLRIGMPQ